MKLDHPRDVCFKHCAGGFGTRDTPTLDERRSRGPISLHNAIGSEHCCRCDGRGCVECLKQELPFDTA
jgi:hypothetical protein